MTDERCRRAFETAERYADGVASEEEWQAAQAGVEEIRNAWRVEDKEAERQFTGWEGPVYQAPTAAEKATEAALGAISFTDNGLIDAAGSVADSAAWAVGIDAGYEAEFRDAEYAEHRFQATLLRCIIGNPFRPVVIDPSWLVWNDGTVVKSAQSIYDDKRFEDLPILADALEDAGCTDPDILGHCRGGGEHVRGCWLVDLILGKE
jgi:hypothetical protein